MVKDTARSHAVAIRSLMHACRSTDGSLAVRRGRSDARSAWMWFVDRVNGFSQTLAQRAGQGGGGCAGCRPCSVQRGCWSSPVRGAPRWPRCRRQGSPPIGRWSGGGWARQRAVSRRKLLVAVEAHWALGEVRRFGRTRRDVAGSRRPGARRSSPMGRAAGISAVRSRTWPGSRERDWRTSGPAASSTRSGRLT